MLIPYCKVECNLGVLFIKQIPRLHRGEFCSVLFIPADSLLPTLEFTYNRLSNKLPSSSSWKEILDVFDSMESSIYELKRIITETFKWLDCWQVSATFDLYDNYLDKQI